MKIKWLFVSDIAKDLNMSIPKLKTWLLSKECPFGFGLIDNNGKFLCYVEEKNYLRWKEKCEKTGSFLYQNQTD